MLPIIRFFVLYLLATGVGFSLTMMFARREGFAVWQLVAFMYCLNLTPVLLLPRIRQLPTRPSFAVAIAAVGVALVCLLRIPHGVLWYWAIGPCIGITMVTFWVVYLTRHVTAGPERANAFNSSVITAIQFGSAVFSPVIAGLLGTRWGIPGVIGGSAVLLVLCLSQLFAVEPADVPVRLRESVRALPTYARVLLYLQGMIEATQFGLLAICTTAYLTEPLPFGRFIGIVAFVGSATNLVISRWSDRAGNRSRMIYIGLGLMAVGAAGLAVVRDIRLWTLFAGCTSSGFTITLPYFMAVTLDASPTIAGALASREWICNLGRGSTFIAAMLLLWLTGDVQNTYFFVLAPIAGYAGVLFVSGRRGLLVPVGETARYTAAMTAETEAETARP